MVTKKLSRTAGSIALFGSLLAAPCAVPAQEAEKRRPAVVPDTLEARIAALEARMDSVLSELESLKRALAEASVRVGRAAPPGGAPEAPDELAAAAPEDELEALREAARAAAEEAKAAAPAEEPEEPQPSRARSLRFLNPEISVTGDVIGSVLAPSGGEARATAIPREFEVAFQAVLDPFARTAIFLSREEELVIAGLTPPDEAEEEGGAEIGLEEGYVDWIALPVGMDIKLGQFRQELGLYNRWHTHALFEADRSAAVTTFLGDDGLIQTGFSLGLPLLQTGSLTQSTWVEVTAGTNEALFDGGNQPSFLGRTQSFFDLSAASYLQVGLNGIAGWNGDVDLDASLVSVDVAYRWTPPGRALYRDLQLKAEWYFARRNQEDLVQHGNGGYGQAHYKFARQWEVGLRTDYVDPYEPEPDILQFAPSITWWQSEWVRLRLQGNVVRRIGESTNFTLLFQTVWAVGPHKHETY